MHRKRNSVADTLLIEMYASAITDADLEANPHGFITSNSEDFSLFNGDKRVPHEDLADCFATNGSRYWLGVGGLDSALLDAFGEDYQELLDESDFREEPRRLDEIVDAESELFDHIWYNRTLSHKYRLQDAGDEAERQRLAVIAGPAKRRVEERFGGPDHLGPYTDFEWGMLNGKLSALRWVLSSEWDSSTPDQRSGAPSRPPRTSVHRLYGDWLVGCDEGPACWPGSAPRPGSDPA